MEYGLAIKDLLLNNMVHHIQRDCSHNIGAWWCSGKECEARFESSRIRAQLFDEIVGLRFEALVGASIVKNLDRILDLNHRSPLARDLSKHLRPVCL